MKAIISTAFGPPDVLRIKEVEKPTPKENEILVRVYATSINYGDLAARNFKNIPARMFNMPLLLWLPARLAFGLNKPNVEILGSEFAGEVEAVGAGVRQFKPGDPIFGYLGQRMGAYAEYLCLAEDATVARKPANLSYAEAAVVPYGALMALPLLQKMNIQPGQKVLVNGASGSIGAAAVQIAKHYGAEVTGVCSTPRLEFVKALGADKVIDYTQEDFTQNGETYDLIFDVLGKSLFADSKNSLTPNGRVLYASFKLRHLLDMLWTSMFGSQKVICALASESQENLVAIKELIEAGKIYTVVDQCFPMEQAAEAHDYVESGQKKGYIAITMVSSHEVR
jgi:NADPH:quinone reductase-like Zn-dependent oxidoreductase